VAYQFTLDDLQAIKVYNEYGQYIIKNSNKVHNGYGFGDFTLKQRYHSGFIYEGNIPIYFYNTFLNPGTVIYNEDETYNNPYASDYDKRFIFIQQTSQAGFEESYNITNEYGVRSIVLIKRLYARNYNIDLTAPSDNTR